MNVPIEHHRRVVGILVASIFVIFCLLAILVFKFGLFYPQEPATKYLQNEEAVVVVPDSQATSTAPVILPVEKVLFEYIEVVEGCDPYFVGECLNVRSGPGEDFPIITRLRHGIVLKVGGKVERNGRTWYKIVFDEWLRYPERVTTDWYVSADYVTVLLDEGNRNLTSRVVSTKKIIVDRAKEMLYAYDGDVLFMETQISTGLELTPTPIGTFTIFKKTPSRYMQGPVPGIPNAHYYDLPGVPWDLFFTWDGAAIHGTYWHQNFGKPASNGCVNLPLNEARKLYNWAEVGALVVVQD